MPQAKLGHLPIAMTYIPHQKRRKEKGKRRKKQNKTTTKNEKKQKQKLCQCQVFLHDQFVIDLHVHNIRKEGGTPATGSRRGGASGSGKGARVLK